MRCLLFTLSRNLFQGHIPIINQVFNVVELLENRQIFLMKPKMGLQTTFQHERLLAKLALKLLIVFVRTHMLPQSSLPRERFPTDLTRPYFPTGMADHVVYQTTLGKEPGVARIALVILLLQMVMPYMAVELEFLLIRFVTRVARVRYWLGVVHLD